MLTATSSDKIDLSSEKKTKELADKISKRIKPGNIIFFTAKWGLVKPLL